MPANDFPESVRHLVFEHIDSVEQLEVLLYMRLHGAAAHDSAHVSAQLRSNPQSVLVRLQSLKNRGFLTQTAERFQYAPAHEELDMAVAKLAEIYKVRPHKIFELIFSPLKKGRQFANAFLVTAAKTADDGKPEKDPDNG